MTQRSNTLLGATLLVTGTTVGAGMLALPVATAPGGFYPALMIFLGVWLMMLMSAFCLVELSLQMPVGTHLVSMARETMGWWGQQSAWWVYLALLYALNAAYLSSLSHLMAGFVADHWHFSLPVGITALVWVGVFMVLVVGGMHHFDRCNRFLMTGLCVVFAVLCGKIVPHGHASLRTFYDVGQSWQGLPIVVTAFGFHIIVPSLRRFCGVDSRRVLPRAMVYGSVVPIVMYALWTYSIMSVVPHGTLLSMLHQGQPAAAMPHVLGQLLGPQDFVGLSRWLSFFAVTTSFLGVSLSLMDFLFDGLQWQRSFGRMSCIFMLTFLPPLAFTLFYPHGFVLALTYAGYFVSYLLIFLPACMVWRHRQQQDTTLAVFRVPGGRAMLLTLMLFASLVVIISHGH